MKYLPNEITALNAMAGKIVYEYNAKGEIVGGQTRVNFFEHLKAAAKYNTKVFILAYCLPTAAVIGGIVWFFKRKKKHGGRK